ncbi:MAG TPA: XRE family transcriptional regulator [Nitrospirae bacterium]|nr:XRE family transcriptional regulator [Nitrospirota bacterium]
MIAFGENILLWRLHRSLSQERLAALSNIPRPNLSNIEKGKRDVTLSTIRSLANALGALPGTLVNGEPPEHKKHAGDLSREFMERIAGSVARGKPPGDREEHRLYQLLREVLRCSLKCAREPRRRLPLPAGKCGLAWLRLRALYPPEIVNSLIARTRERAERI